MDCWARVGGLQALSTQNAAAGMSGGSGQQQRCRKKYRLCSRPAGLQPEGHVVDESSTSRSYLLKWSTVAVDVMVELAHEKA